MNEQRKYIRYLIERRDISAAVEINEMPELSGRVVDLSTGGLSFVIEGISREPELEEFIFIRIICGNISINAEIEKRWGLLRVENGLNVYSAGASFNVISGEDRLKLNEIIEKIRSGSISRDDS